MRSNLTGHTALVASLAIARDGELLASGSFDKTVRLWDVASGQPRAPRTHGSRAGRGIFPRRAVPPSAGSDKTVRIWNVDRGETIEVFLGHTDTVRALTFNSSGTMVVSSSDDRTIRGFDVNAHREAFSLPCRTHNSALAFSPDGTSLAFADDRGNLSIWDVITWTGRWSVKGSDTGIWGLCFSPDGRTLATACGDAKVRLWDPITGQVMLYSTATPSASTLWRSRPTGRPCHPPATMAQSDFAHITSLTSASLIA